MSRLELRRFEGGGNGGGNVQEVRAPKPSCGVSDFDSNGTCDGGGVGLANGVGFLSG